MHFIFWLFGIQVHLASYTAYDKFFTVLMNEILATIALNAHSSHESRTRGTKTGFILFALAISVIGSKAEPSFPYWRTSEVSEAQGNIINIKYHHK